MVELPGKLDGLDGQRFYNKDGYSLLYMFDDYETLVIDVCSPELEEVSEGTYLPIVLYSHVIKVDDSYRD